VCGAEFLIANELSLADLAVDPAAGATTNTGAAAAAAPGAAAAAAAAVRLKARRQECQRFVLVRARALLPVAADVPTWRLKYCLHTLIKK
jgi:hypothetical protein